MYCKLYIHCSSVKSIVALFEKEFGNPIKKISCYYFQNFDVSFDMNEETDHNKMRTYPDGFLYYELKAEFEIYDNYIQITDLILKLLWDNRIPAVVFCDYEEELNRYIFSL